MSACKCRVETRLPLGRWTGSVEAHIVYCPLHAAAPALFASLQSFVAWADAGFPSHAPDESIFPAARALLEEIGR